MDVVSVTSPVGFWRVFWSSKWAETAITILAARHSQIIKSGQKGRMWVELDAETTPTKCNSGDSSGNPPVTQVATPLIMQNFKVYNLNVWVIKTFTPITVVMKGKISYIDQNHFLHQAVNMFFSAVKLGILTWGVYGIDSLLQPASSGQSMNCTRGLHEREREVATCSNH